MRGSGDLLADRRFAYAEDLLAEGDVEAAADLFEQTIERVPVWGPAWIALGLARERQGRPDAATAAFEQAQTCDPAGLYGADLHLARLKSTGDGSAMPAAFVTALFDDYAPRFETHLVEGLGYRGPALLAAAVLAADGRERFARVLDLGCGTGLMGSAIRAHAGHLTGIDLSSAMLAQAERRGAYDSLLVAEILSFLASLDPASFDLVLAADVFAYLGSLAPVLGAAAQVLPPRGLLAFTVQRGSDAPVTLGSDMRYSHSAGHVTESLGSAGFDLLSMEEASSRRDAGVAVPGLVVVARRA